MFDLNIMIEISTYLFKNRDLVALSMLNRSMRQRLKNLLQDRKTYHSLMTELVKNAEDQWRFPSKVLRGQVYILGTRVWAMTTDELAKYRQYGCEIVVKGVFHFWPERRRVESSIVFANKSEVYPCDNRWRARDFSQ